MDKLIHTPDGKLQIDDPFLTEGNRFKYDGGDTVVVDTLSISRNKELWERSGDKDIVWARWPNGAHYHARRNRFTPVENHNG